MKLADAKIWTTLMAPLPGITIRAAHPDESAALAELLHSAFAEQRGRIRPESAALSETPESIAARFADHGIAVAERAGRLLGCVFFQRRGDAIHFGRLATRPECRGQGIASALVDHVEGHARRSGAARISLGVRIALTENRRYFEARGYREAGRETHPGFTAPTSIRYEKEIRD